MKFQRMQTASDRPHQSLPRAEGLRSPSSRLYEWHIAEAATAFREIAGRHLCDDADKRTAKAAAE